MALKDYQVSLYVGRFNPPFYGLIEGARRSAMLNGDSVIADQIALWLLDLRRPMSEYEQEQGQRLARWPWRGVLMTAIRKADTGNMARLGALFPDVVAEFEKRYHAPLGIIPESDGFTVEEYLSRMKEDDNPWSYLIAEGDS